MNKNKNKQHRMIYNEIDIDREINYGNIIKIKINQGKIIVIDEMFILFYVVSCYSNGGSGTSTMTSSVSDSLAS